MVNGTRDFVAPVAEGGLDLTNVKIGTAAGGGLVVVEEVSTGTASGSANTGEFVFQTGVALAPDIQTFNVKWTAINPFPGLPTAPTVREIGGFIGTGDQSNFLKVVAGPNGMLFQLESNGAVIASQTLNAPGVGTAPAGSNLVFELLVNRAHVAGHAVGDLYRQQRAGEGDRQRHQSRRHLDPDRDQRRLRRAGQGQRPRRRPVVEQHRRGQPEHLPGIVRRHPHHLDRSERASSSRR